MNVWRRDPKLRAELALTESFVEVQPPYFTDPILIQFRRAYTAAGHVFRMICTTLRYHVLHVIKLSPQEQMSRIATRRVVALVANEQAARVFTFLKHPRNSVRSMESVSQTELPVTFIVHGGGPRPALIWAPLFYFSPKPSDFGRCHRWDHVGSSEFALLMY
jgi:hypothetical protein